ncbi:lysophospholipase [Arthrobacter sp. SRS-W-1-2016]|jgi:alpha-beta hydrolase superfamily lysophospholipase|uniref:alpha/beta hydrolase n=1 Tax=Arthrobacter TaxID=1663 RepID=UPI0009913EC0|nr:MULTISPECIES: alpha/beta hydrolase [Arthrobacter]MDQ0210751.1 alpha-beta hydrolase superfamily lysophospholipase [Arthrobacter bambusae]MDQ0235423.1 alpha-beta hydrolase superfamily lysophospholipase [Arthrobacter bambusae]OOP65209.1 lysophospholipase [Arthrobacter sp. SRS-W-1-2016]
MEWQTDILGADFESCAFEAAGPDGVVRRATLVRHVPRQGAGNPGDSPPPADRSVLFLHGWSDYFFNVALAEFWTAQGFRFYALDMHNHGRSLQADSPGGYVEHLNDYDAEISKAIDMIRSAGQHGQEPGSLTLMGHSTGGLVAALWASSHPGSVQYLVLNSPWLEMHGSSVVRRAAQTMVTPLARFRPTTILRLPERGFYFRSISSSAEGEWLLDEKYRPPLAFPMRAGWLSAVLSGHTRVARGLRIDIPILVLISGASANGMVWHESMRHSDAVLDVNTMAVRAMTLGRTVTLERVDGGLHDVFLSAGPVRADAYDRLARWIHGYITSGPRTEPPAGRELGHAGETP